MWRPGATRDGYDGYILRFVVVLLSLHGSSKRERTLRQGNRPLLVPDQPVRGRDITRDFAPAVLPVLLQSDARRWLGESRRAHRATVYAGHGPEGRRGDVEIARE